MMTNEQLSQVARELDGLVTRIEEYPLHLQPTILKILWEERKGSLVSDLETAGKVVRQLPENGSGAMPVNGDATDWDYRRGLDKIAEKHNLDLTSPFDYEYVLIVSYVLQFLSPADYDISMLTTDLVNDAWRHADRDIPNRPRAPINKAVAKGLMEPAKGMPGYVLTPKGEKRVKKLLANGR